MASSSVVLARIFRGIYPISKSRTTFLLGPRYSIGQSIQQLCVAAMPEPIQPRSKKDNAFKKYDSSQHKLLLDILNTREPELLITKYHIAPKYAKQITDYTSSAGAFGDLSEIFKVKGLKEENALTLVKKLSSQVIDQKKSEQFLKPPLKENEKPESITCVHLLNIENKTSMSWLHMTSDGHVHDWSRKNIFSNSDVKQDVSKQESRIWDAVQLLPVAERYVMQESVYPARNTQVKSSLHRWVSHARCEAIMSSMLNNRTTQAESYQHRVHRTRYRTVSNYFNLDVDGHRVCAHDTVMDVFRGQCRQARDVTVPSQYRDTYMEAGGFAKEHLSHPLLLAATFYGLFDDQNFDLS